MKLIKKAVEIGNGAAIYIPKSYIGQNVTVMLPEEIDAVKSRILSKLSKHLPQVIGLYLYGSYARGEQTPSSDIDVLVVIEKDDAQIKKSLTGENIDVRILKKDSFKKSIKNFPEIIIPMLKEAQPIINLPFLNDLKKLSSKMPFKFSFHIKDAERIIKIVESFINLDGEIASSHIYSLIMRLRIFFMIETTLKNKNFSNKGFKEKMLSFNLKEKEFDEFYSLYQRVRDDETFESTIEKEKITKLLNITKTYLKEIKNEAKKASRKRNRVNTKSDRNS